jgi:hypothetical protein
MAVCEALLIPVSTTQPLLITQIPHFRRGAPDWLEQLRAHNACVRALVGDPLSGQFDTFKIVDGVSSDDGARDAALFGSIGDDSRGLSENKWWSRIRKAATDGGGAVQTKVYGPLLVHAAEHVCRENETVLGVTKWIDFRGRMHGARDWVGDRGVRLLTTLVSQGGVAIAPVEVIHTGNMVVFDRGFGWRMECEDHHAPGICTSAAIANQMRNDTGCVFAFMETTNGGNFCANCMRSRGESPFQRCGACKNVVYCGAACQRADWVKHKMRCTKATAS